LFIISFIALEALGEVVMGGGDKNVESVANEILYGLTSR
jgi:hypothetical protein